jgi:polyisoprenoid-binding protein YceI
MNSTTDNRTFHKLKFPKAVILAFSGALLTTALVQAAPRTYVVDQDHTFPRFSYNHLGFSTQLSGFDRTTGTITYDPEARTGAVDVTIDTTSVNTGSQLFNQHIQAEEFLHTAKYPTASFRSTGVRFEGDQPVSIDGDLTIKGITRPVTLTVTSFVAKPHPMKRKDAIGAAARTIVKRSDFNMAKHVPAVGDELTLTIVLEASMK